MVRIILLLALAFLGFSLASVGQEKRPEPLRARLGPPQAVDDKGSLPPPNFSAPPPPLPASVAPPSPPVQHGDRSGAGAKSSPSSATRENGSLTPLPPAPERRLFKLDGGDLLPTNVSSGAGSESFWARGEYVFWWLRGSPLPPLITASPAGTPVDDAGVLGNPGTRVLVGDESVNGALRSGTRITVGAWLDECETWGVEANFFVMESQSHQLGAASNGSQIIARPFVDANTGLGEAELVSFPGLLAGSAIVDVLSDPLYGAGGLLRRSIWHDCGGQVCLLAGYRFLHLGEDLQIQENLTSLEPATLGTNIIVTDQFSTRNEFHGADLGIQAEFWQGRWTLGLLAKLGIGNVHRRVEINGSTEVTVPGFAPILHPGGLLALPSNTGVFHSNHLSFVPELGITASRQLSSHWRATLGYTVFWWTSVVRPGEQIDPAVNPNLLPPATAGGPARPTFILQESNLWAHGLRVGLEYRY